MASPPPATPTSTAIAAESAIALAVRGVFTLAVAAGLAALAALAAVAAGLAALAALAAVAAGLAALAALAAVAAGLAALAALAAGLAALPPCAPPPPTPRKPTLTGPNTSRCATLRRRTPTQPCR